MIQRIVRHLGFLLLALALVPGVYKQAMSDDPSSVGKGAPRREVRLPIEDFSLTDQAGRSFRFQGLRGRVVLVTFMYTTCPDVCPLLTANMRLVQENLRPSERTAVFFLSITTDPEVDTASVLKSYGERYKVDFSNWSFAGGDQKSLEKVWKVFGVKVERKARGLVNHTTLTSLIDKKGMMRLVYPGAAPDPKRVLADMRSLLSQGKPSSMR